MPRSALSPEQLDWLKANHTLTGSVRDYAKRLSCDPDTIRRALTKLGLREFEGAKFAPAAPRPQTWKRPCIRCRAPEKRPRMQFLCESCTRYADRRFAAKSVDRNPHECPR